MGVAERLCGNSLRVDRGDGRRALVMRHNNCAAVEPDVTRCVGRARHNQIHSTVGGAIAFLSQTQGAGSDVFGVGREVPLASRRRVALIGENLHADRDLSGAIVGSGDRESYIYQVVIGRPKGGVCHGAFDFRGLGIVDRDIEVAGSC